MQPKRASFKQHAIAFAVVAAFQPQQLLAQTMPSGGQVAAGQATISHFTPSYLQVDQASDKAILNWQSFSIGAGGQVQFVQPSSTSVALNRVLGNNPSQIFGNLGANGRVFLVNPSGILFGPGSSVNVGALVASTLSITDDDFLAGRYTFSNAGGAGSILNQGNLFSHSGYTALLAPQVTNEGFIFANMGNVALAAGDRVSLDMVGDNLIRVSVEQAALNAAVVNTGNIEAFGGNVLLAAHSANALLDTVLNTQGFVRAARMIEQGGEIVLDGGSQGNVAVGGGVFGDGHLTLSGADVTVSGFASSGGGQTVAARSLTVQALGGNGASLSNSGGDQRITLTGDGTSGGLDVVSDGSAFASIGHFDAPAYAQFITVIDGDHIRVDGGGGPAGPFFPGAGIFAGGSAQHISITGGGRNAIVLGSEGATAQSAIGALEQTIVAGTGSQSGSITLIGSSATNAFVGITTEGGSGPQTQSISTTGALRIAGAQAPAQNTVTGIFHNRQGQQTIRAADVDVVAAASGLNNGVFINVNGGADQRIEMAGGTIRVISGQGGANNTAGIGNQASGNQTIVGNPDIFVAGGATSNASIQAGLGRTQTIEARNITLTNGLNSPGNSAGVLLAPRQRITATGDVTLTARSGTGTASGVRIGGSSNGAPTDLVLNVGGDLVLTGGTSGTNGAGLGGAGTVPTGSNDINVDVAGDLILDGAVGGGGVRIGSSAATPVQAGNISVAASRIEFRGTAPAAIRTLGKVTLDAGEIQQAANGLILGNALATTSTGSTVLGGANNVSSFTGSAGGELFLRNVSAFLTLGPVDAAGTLGIDQAGSLLIQATDAPLVVRGGLVNVATGGDFRLVGGDADGAHALLSSGGNIDLTVGGALRLDEGAGKFSSARIQAGKGGVISLTGDFFVNGVEGDTRDGKSGFFIFHKPARIGHDLILD
jgi:filamentous hemagglutinin family protein